jgi:lysine decarboxylase
VRPGITPLIQALLEHQGYAYQPFHMPGHKQGHGQPGWFREILGSAVFTFDLTELFGLDDLHSPGGAINEAQQAAASCFGAEESFFLINGSTVGIQAMVLAAAGVGDEMLIPRQAHRSVVSGLILSGARPQYLQVQIDPKYQIPLGTGRFELMRAIRDNQQANSLLVVHPNYYGITSNISSLLKEAKSKGLICMADEAHGPHFRFHEQLPISALEAGVDATTQSLHKLLSSLTQTALLHRQGKQLRRERLIRCLDILQSTSPSYVLMASLDSARWQVQEEGNYRLERTLELAQKARENINQMPGLSCLGDEVRDNSSVGEWDPTKLLINVRGLGLTGYQAQAILRDSYRIQMEMADQYNILAMITIGDSSEGVEDLVKAFGDLASRYPAKGKDNLASQNFEACAKIWNYPPEVIKTPREAFFWQQTRGVILAEAEGEIAAETVSPYPPGVPILTPGERITRPVIEAIKELTAAGATWQGPIDKTLNKIQILDIT